MKTTAKACTALLPLLAALALSAGCKSGDKRADSEPPPAPALDLEDGPPVIVGTVVDAATGAPVAGARVVAPDGTEATSGSDGRFRLKGLAAGTAGELVATSGALRGAVRLRPVSGGRLEVVLHVR